MGYRLIYISKTQKKISINKAGQDRFKTITSIYYKGAMGYYKNLIEFNYNDNKQELFQFIR